MDGGCNHTLIHTHCKVLSPKVQAPLSAPPRRSLAYPASALLSAVSGFLCERQNTHLVECYQMKGWNLMSDLNVDENAYTAIDGDDPIHEGEADYIDALCEYLAQGDELALEWLECFFR